MRSLAVGLRRIVEWRTRLGRPRTSAKPRIRSWRTFVAAIICGTTFLMLAILAAVLAGSPSVRAQTAVRDSDTPARQKVLILIDQKARHIDLNAALRGLIQRAGGHARAVIGLAGIIAEIEPRSRAGLAATKGVVGVYSSPIAAPRSADAQTLAVLAAWNRVQAGTTPAAKPSPAGSPPGAQQIDVIQPQDLPNDPAQLPVIKSEYDKHWKELQGKLSPQLKLSSGVGCGTNGAGYYDTSLFFAGGIAVDVFYVNGSAGGWTQAGSMGSASTAQTFGDIVASLDQYIDKQPDANLVFTYVNEVDNSGNPLPPPGNSTAELTTVNDLRNTWCTDWAFMVSVQNGGMPYAGIANLQGPSFRVDRTASIFDYAIRHETGHMFGAIDQYAPWAPSPLYGYLMVANGNACGNDGNGFFAGAGECLDDLMAGWQTGTFGYNFIIGPYTAGQFGWYDSVGNGVLDVTRTKPVIDAASVVHVIGNSSQVTYSGVAFDRPLLNQMTSPYYGNVSINRIAAVQYQINTSPWQDATPADGVFDSVSEGFNFTTPNLPYGTYTVQIRAINTIGAVTPIPYTEQITITGTSQTNTRPFGSISLTPVRAKYGTLIKASGAASRDLEPGTLQYSWNWGSGWTAFSSNPTSSNTFTSTQTGPQTVQMRVRDSGGLVHLVSRSIIVEAYDTAPVVAFTAVPENRHFTSGGPNYSVSLSVAGSYDGETPTAGLTVQWDIDCTGTWSASSSQMAISVPLVNTNYPKSDRRCMRARVKDGGGNTTDATRFVWAVPYNHPPSFLPTAVTFAPSGPDFIATVNATDADLSTSWDGMLQYRFDYEGDGIWDTKFDPNPSIPLPAAYRNTLVVEIRDRFDARAQWTAAGCGGGPLPAC